MRVGARFGVMGGTVEALIMMAGVRIRQCGSCGARPVVDTGVDFDHFLLLRASPATWQEIQYL